MQTLRTRWSAFIDRQHRMPSGIIGRLIGERMLRQHTPETDWSVDLLDLQPADRVLELGFGAGRALAQMVQRVPDGLVVGLDCSATMIHAAAWRNRQALARRQLVLLRGDLAQLPFGSGQFNKIVSIHTFYFWPDVAAICDLLIRQLAFGGRLVATFATAQTLASGERHWWPVHEQAVTLVDRLQQHSQHTARLLSGPDSRQFNNVAIMVERSRPQV